MSKHMTVCNGIGEEKIKEEGTANCCKQICK